MRNYPLFDRKNNMPTPRNWQNTYVNSLVMHTKSLVDYSNYFLADYRRGAEFTQIMEENPETHEMVPVKKDGFPCFSIEKLRYHQYWDTEEEGWYFLYDSDYPDFSKAKKIRAGRHIVNNNQKESNLDSYKDWENIVIQPIGYTAFYIMTYSQNKFYFTYTRNAQLYYGLDQPISPMGFYTRFFYRKNEIRPNDRDLPTIQVPSQPYRQIDYDEEGSPILTTEWGILDKQGLYWTDIELNPVMGFLFKKDEETAAIGEEIIIDTKVRHTIEVEKNSTAVYTMTALGELASGQVFYPSGSTLYFL